MLAPLAGIAPFQIALVVRDIERAVREIDGVAGAGPWRGYDFGSAILESSECYGQAAEWSARIVLNDSRPQLELVQPVAGPTIHADWLERHGEGVHHLAYAVASVAETSEQMAAAGYPAVMTGRGFGVDGDGAFAYYDTFERLGFVVEAVEPPGSMPATSFRL